jgi:predicted peroxiredoxin
VTLRPSLRSKAGLALPLKKGQWEEKTSTRESESYTVRMEEVSKKGVHIWVCVGSLPPLHALLQKLEDLLCLKALQNSFLAMMPLEISI